MDSHRYYNCDIMLGINIDIKVPEYGVTAADIARTNGFIEIYKYLKAFPYSNSNSNNNNNNNNNNTNNNINRSNDKKTCYRKVEIPSIPDSPPKATDWGENSAVADYRGPDLSTPP